MDQLIEHALTLASQPATPLIAPIKNRIAYVVSHGQSYASNGYAIRTQSIAKALNEHGFDTLCFVRPGRPWELGATMQPESTVDGVRYIHSRWSNDEQPANEQAHLEQSVQRFTELFRIYRPQVVLAASNYIVGLPAWIAARRLGLPFYNEVRGFWELSRDAREPGYANTSEFKAEALRDTFVAKQAQKVFTLNQPMADELSKRGIAENNIAIVPNGVSKLSEIRPADPRLKARLGINKNEKVIGYVGSFNAYEGLETLIEACEQLTKQGENIKLLLVGDDHPVTQRNEKLPKPDKNSWLIQTGRVPYEQIPDYYALIDVVVIPRKNDKVCQLVQPTKFLEASYFNLPILLPEYCKAAVNDYLNNAVFYKEGKLLDTIKSILPYTQCGKYKDDKSKLYHPFHKVTAIKNELLNHSFGSNITYKNNIDRTEDAFRRVIHCKAERLSLNEEKEIRELTKLELSIGHISNALALAKYTYEKNKNHYSLKVYIKALFSAQKYDHIVRLCEKRDNLGHEVTRFFKMSQSYLALFDEYFNVSKRVIKKNERNKNKSVYFLHSSLPYFSGGYATRAHGLANALIKKGLDVRAYTRPNFPYDVKKEIPTKNNSVKVDNITYHKTNCESVRLRDEASYMLDCVEAFDEVIKKEKPGYIHGRSTYQISLPALIAAKKNNLPFIYEVSGLWEIVHESRDTAPQRKHETEKIRHLETMVAKKADLVFTLTGAMKDELISRGVDGSKITILPNCTNPDKFFPCEKSQSLLNKLGIGQKTPVIGYIGSFQDYEGLDDLIAACEILSDRKPDLDYRLLLVGDGPYYKQICDLAKNSSVKDKIIITGRVPHSLASEYYSVVDIAPFPRKSWPVCEMVSPMKPLEALAMEKTVLVSSVKALSEMIINGETGIIFEKGSIISLSKELSNLLADSAQRKKLGKYGRAWVRENRTWSSIANIFLDKLS
ncbi:glycosyltransferase [Oceanimonas baumannii]|uniref:Glycosyltransferase involved in cell wall biosynthesis n=1 Tax=Oceanimonas baumannii TaxID=129578 RepID=A0A235C9R0_9GAMM|nr:glycosyltransferase [Oceanimonas baumannii]OYD21129.1 hypothetical protein B6S09_17440 [Oceanimonas baumannii]TDW56960.1 glycosyltransferase involved in cell wall biosynthesis [Oceanimonas baumannii]